MVLVFFSNEIFMCMSIIYRQTDHTLQQHSNCTEDMDVSVCIEPGHLFRYKKEVNPKNKKSKVSNYSLKPVVTRAWHCQAGNM